MKIGFVRENISRVAESRNKVAEHSDGSSNTTARMDTIVQRMPLCPCDGGCPRCSPSIQPKLKIGEPNDRYEREADRIADQVMAMPEPAVQRAPT